MKFNVNDVVALYIRLRNRKAAIKAEADAKTVQITEQMLKLEAWLKQQADQLGTTQFKTPSGTAFFKTEDFASVADWDEVLRFIKDSGNYNMLEKRVSKTVVRGYIEEYKQVPPGVNYGTKLVLNIRKPPTKAD